MRTQNRLIHACQTARAIPFDDESRSVFISDCHRGAGSLSDGSTHNEDSEALICGHTRRSDCSRDGLRPDISHRATVV